MASMLGIQVLAFAIGCQNNSLVAAYRESLDPERRPAGPGSAAWSDPKKLGWSANIGRCKIAESGRGQGPAWGGKCSGPWPAGVTGPHDLSRRAATVVGARLWLFVWLLVNVLVPIGCDGPDEGPSDTYDRWSPTMTNRTYRRPSRSLRTATRAATAPLRALDLPPVLHPSCGPDGRVV
jgi:hypothetical protein